MAEKICSLKKGSSGGTPTEVSDIQFNANLSYIQTTNASVGDLYIVTFNAPQNYLSSITGAIEIDRDYQSSATVILMQATATTIRVTLTGTGDRKILFKIS